MNSIPSFSSPHLATVVRIRNRRFKPSCQVVASACAHLKKCPVSSFFCEKRHSNETAADGCVGGLLIANALGVAAVLGGPCGLHLPWEYFVRTADSVYFV